MIRICSLGCWGHQECIRRTQLSCQNSFWWQQLTRARTALVPVPSWRESPCLQSRSPALPEPRARGHPATSLVTFACPGLAPAHPRALPSAGSTTVPGATGYGTGPNPWAQLILVPPRAATWQEGWPWRRRRWQLPGSAAVTARASLWWQRVGNKTHPATLLAAGPPGAEKGLCSFRNIS